MNYTGKHVLVLGLGESGLASALWLAHCGATVRVADTRSAPERLPLLQQAIPAVEFVGPGDDGGGFAVSLLDGIDFAVTSPGLAPGGELKEILSAATDRNIPVWGEIEIFAQALAALRESQAYAPKVIAITGTNGKTTVTSLTGLLCERAGLTVQVAGNISPAALDVLRSALENDALPQVWVLELSSFQLHATCNLHADAATILNISQDHLDWHGDMASYVADKARIFSADTMRVLNRDDPLTMQFKTGNSTSFGFDEPVEGDCFGLVSDNGMQWLSVAVPGDEEERVEKRRGKKEQLALLPVSVKRLMPADALRIRGRHNAANALAALALCRAIDLPFAPLLHGLREYHGEPHRVELVTTIGGVEYYDDSKGTNVGATVAALNGLGRGCDGGGNASRLLLIAGGEGKGQDFAPLAAPLAAYGRALLLIGRDAAAIRAAVESHAAGIDIIACATLEQAVARAAELAHPGDAVLLSPACASFDMFRNYAHRAQVFVDAVRELALSRGEVGL
ncbi:UDP-N-acetylmuramoyl-L-alanine--D-glutamate ligase [Collimonas silvisoli]|uniref:UDP-N-acetylmuramoyl-L-alanine--D-glutamate ligase n=1 Tax=Collimonas silvisoli TaxID=2825884 RepID=UPI001B8AD428|nr:UDP-N-acetylmuramoyl-L-alanine--D-glutamate ligase [Collimonas silvisoli]